jgi:hypothetical protein
VQQTEAAGIAAVIQMIIKTIMSLFNQKAPA